VESISSVIITVRGEPLFDGSGYIVTAMTADMFIDNVGNEMNAYEKTSLRLYFANVDGDGLRAVNRSDVVYNSNIALEKLIVESVIAGPIGAENVQAAVNPATKLLGVTTTDSTCYVNLDDGFKQLILGISPEHAIYAITNSLSELPNINRVRISINGESTVIFETINLSTVFERNLDIVR
jgi:germination protein M